MLALDFYLNEDVVSLAKQCLGKALYTKIDGKVTGGLITETEAYRGPQDRASHAYNNRRTKRTEVMFAQGGVCYVYLCYGVHYLLNIVTNQEEIPHAILLRGLHPTKGIEHMKRRRGKRAQNLASGPGTLTEALGVDHSFNGQSLLSKKIWIEETGITIGEEEVEAVTRVGIGYAKEDALLPWRFCWKGPL